MRFEFILTSLSVTMLASVSAWADPVGHAAPPDSPAPPAAGYPPPPPGYPAPPPGYPAPIYVEARPERTALNSIYIEGLGPGLLYSINYDRTFGDFAGRVGFSYLSLGASASDGTTTAESHAAFITVPLTVTYIGIGSKKNIFEIGAGVTIVHVGGGVSTIGVKDSKTASGSATILLGDLILGYRLQPPDGGFLLRVGLSPITGGGVFLPLPYLALGGTF